MKYNAYVLCKTEPQFTKEAFRKLTDIVGVKTCYQTTGNFDAVLFLNADDPQTLSRLVVEKIRSIKGIRSTETLFAFEEI